MNRRVFPYDPPLQQTNYQDPVYYNNSVPNDYYPYEQVHQQSPFEYFSKPSQAENWPYAMSQNLNEYQFQQQNPYIQQPGQQSNPTPGILAQFQTPEGQMDVQKMLSTVGQLANTVQQVSPVIKEIGAMIRVFR